MKRIPKTAAARERAQRRKEELARRRKLKAELKAECPTDQGGRKICPLCGKLPDFRGLQLIHKTALSKGGKTTRENCCIGCAPCHFGFKFSFSHRTEGRPKTGRFGLDNGVTKALQ